ncbi:ABC transporter permease [Pseudonocardia lutea]|uniref:ABC transporter permease n=1 Tax=Pseudonocardia lutea TaxID=2172015 RepID=A0ABW1IDT1_9PSEU
MPVSERDVALVAPPPRRPRRRPTVSPTVLVGAGLALAVGAVFLRPVDPTGLLWIGVLAGGVLAAWRGLTAHLATRLAPGFEPGVWLAVTWLVLVAGAALFADLLPLAEGQDPSLTLNEPIMAAPDLFSAHPLGTDRQGLDVLSGVVYGARISLVVGPGAVLLGLVVGGLLGVLAGYHRKLVDSGLTLLNDALLAFPPLILLLALAAVVRPSVLTMTAVLGVLAIPTFYRLARANTLVFAQRGYVLAARAVGARGSRVLLKEIVPNVVMAALSYAFVVVAVLIVAEASLSFLGLGIPRPQPTWGNMIAAGQQDVERNPHLVFVPGAVLFLTVLSLNRVGDWTRRHWDPRARKI